MSDVTRRYRQLENEPEHLLWFFCCGTGTLFLLVTSLIVQVATPGEYRLVTLIFFLLGLGFWALLVRSALEGRIQARWSGLAMAIAVAAMLAIAPATSKDFNSYALYGRMVAEYGASPYTHVPLDFASDPWFARTSIHWSDSPAVYGPAFVGMAATVMTGAGTSVLSARLGFQLIAAVSLLLSVCLLSRRIGAVLAIVVVGLNPLLLTFGVNDAHVDVLIGLTVLAAVLALEKRHVVVAGVSLGIAASLKISLLPALLGAFVWCWFRISRKAGFVLAIAAVVTVAVGLALSGFGDSLKPLSDASLRHTRFSVWNPLYNSLNTGNGTDATLDAVLSKVATLIVVAVGLVAMWRSRRDKLPVVAVCSLLIAYQVLGFYTLSWYAAWTIPALAILFVAKDRTAFWISMGYGCWLAIAYLSGYAAIIAAVLLVIVLATRRQLSQVTT